MRLAPPPQAHKGRPPRLREKPVRRRQEHAVARLKLWASNLPFRTSSLWPSTHDLTRLVT
jgi:hypothetical protein